MNTWRYLCVVGIAFSLSLAGGVVRGQNVPFISRISPTHAEVGSEISVLGASFPAQSNLKVYFGSIEGTILSRSATLLRVQVPVSAQADYVRVLDTSSKRIAASPQIFTPHFVGGTHVVGAAVALEAPNVDNNSNPDPLWMYDVCACDFDGDGDLDVAATQRVPATETKASTLIPVFVNTNTTAAAAPTFSSNASDAIANGQPTINVVCGDLNGDGYADLVASQGRQGATAGTNIYITPGSSSGLSTSAQSLRLPQRQDGKQRQVRRVALGDIDGDGRLDIVAANVTDSVLFVFRNTTSSATIAFEATPYSIAATPQNRTYARFQLLGLAIGDMDGDLVPDVVVSTQTSPDHVVILRNLSRPGQMALASAVEVAQPNRGSLINIALADLNDDGKMDIAATTQVSGEGDVIYFLNEGSGAGNLRFARPTLFSTALGNLSVIPRPWGIAAGDINGDGYTDVVATDLTTSRVHAFQHGGNNNTLAFTHATIPFSATIANNFDLINVKLADVNGDGRLDILAVSEKEKKFYIKPNATCISTLPLRPNLPLSNNREVVCASPVTRFTTIALPGLTYTWSVTPEGGTATETATTNAYLDFGASYTAGNYTLKVSADYSPSTCASTRSLDKSIEKKAGSPAAATLSAETAVCAHGTETETITPTGVSNASAHRWRGPGNFTATTLAITLPKTAVQAGQYTYYYTDANGCPSDAVSTTYSVIQVPKVAIRVVNGLPLGCDNSGNRAVLSVPKVLEGSAYAGYAYQWKRQANGGFTNISGATAARHIARAPGAFQLALKATSNSLTCEEASETLTIELIDRTTANFEIDPKVVCKEKVTTFSPTAVTIPPSAQNRNLTLTYNWNFGDGNASSGSSAQKSYNNAGRYDVNLMVGYEGVVGCEHTSPAQEVNVIEPPRIRIAMAPTLPLCPDPNDAAKMRPCKCPLEQVVLSGPEQVTSGNFTQDVVKYTWTIGQTSPQEVGTSSSISVTQADSVYTLKIEDVALCESEHDTIFYNKADKPVELSIRGQEDPKGRDIKFELQEGESKFVEIKDGRLLSYLPTIGIEKVGDNLLEVIGHYRQPGPDYPYTVYVIDGAQCIDQPRFTYSLVRGFDKTPKGYSLFTPNRAAPFQNWNMYKLEFNPNVCDLRIFDRRGSVVYSENQLPQNWNGWNGYLNGKLVDEGVYFYTIRCNCEEDGCPRTGTGSFILVH